MNRIVYKALSLFLFLSSSYSLFAHVELDNPVGGETFVSGTTVTIQWHITIAHNTLNWDLLFSPDGGNSWEPIQFDLPAGNLSYQWHVPDGATSLARVSVIQDNDAQDYQDESSNFTITSTPTAVTELNGIALKIFPNPAQEMLTIDFDRSESLFADIILFNSFGIPMWYFEDKTNSMMIPVRQFANGIYFLQIRTNEGTITRKIIIAHS